MTIEVTVANPAYWAGQAARLAQEFLRILLHLLQRVEIAQSRCSGQNA